MKINQDFLLWGYGVGMLKIADKWAGRIFGTNTGNLYIEFQQEDEKLSGTLRLMDSMFGLTVYALTGGLKDGKVVLKGVPQPTPTPTVQMGELSAEALLTPEGYLRGTWLSSLGTAGTFEAYPHYVDSTTQNATQKLPEQSYYKSIPIGSIRLFSQDVKRLLLFIEQDFQKAQSVVTYNIRGIQATKYSNEFLKEVESLGEIKELKISIQEPEAYGINKIIIVDFLESGLSEIRVSGINEAWVVGKAESILELLRPKKNNLVTTYKKYGLNINTIIFFLMLVFIPELSDWTDRGKFVLIVFILLNILYWIHSRFIPNTKIFLTEKKPSLLARSWPSIVSWFIATTSTVLAGWLLYILKKG